MKMAQPFISEDETVKDSDRDEPPEGMENELGSDAGEHGDNTEMAREENNDVMLYVKCLCVLSLYMLNVCVCPVTSAQ